MGATLVQKKGAQSGFAVASLAVTLTSAPTAGNTLIACCNSDATIATPAGFTLAVSAVSGQGLYIFVRDVQAGDSATVTFTPSVSDAVAGGVLEYSGLTATPLDKVASNTTNSAATAIATGTTGITAQADELLIVVVGPHAGNGHPWVLSSWTAGYTSQIEEPEGLNGASSAACHIGDRIVTATGTYSATGTWTPASSDAGAAIATFKIAAAAGHTVSIGLASETDTAQAVKPLRTRALGTVQETDVAQQVKPLRARLIGLGSEADTALAIRPLRSRALGTALETDSARAIGHSKARTIGLVLETDAAFAITPALSSVVGFDYLAAGRARVGWHAGEAKVNWHAGRARVS